MKNYEEILAEAIRVEYSDNGDMFLVFKIKKENFKKYIKENWFKDVEFKLVDKKLVEDD